MSDWRTHPSLWDERYACVERARAGLLQARRAVEEYPTLADYVAHLREPWRRSGAEVAGMHASGRAAAAGWVQLHERYVAEAERLLRECSERADSVTA